MRGVSQTLCFKYCDVSTLSVWYCADIVSAICLLLKIYTSHVSTVEWIFFKLHLLWDSDEGKLLQIALLHSGTCCTFNLVVSLFSTLKVGNSSVLHLLKFGCLSSCHWEYLLPSFRHKIDTVVFQYYQNQPFMIKNQVLSITVILWYKCIEEWLNEDIPVLTRTWIRMCNKWSLGTRNFPQDLMYAWHWFFTMRFSTLTTQYS